MIKPRAKTELIFKPDKDDDWFIYIIQKEKKSGKENKKMIIQKDLEDFKKMYLSNGWLIEDIKNPAETKKKAKK